MTKLALTISLIAGAAGATDLYVDGSATASGDCISAPCLRITDALAVARRLGGADIHVAPGVYNGTTDPAKLAANPALEALPILLNVPGLHLHGASTLVTDSEGLPAHAAKGPATKLNADSLGAFVAMISVTPTVDAATGAPTSGPLGDISVDGFEFMGTPAAFGTAVQLDRVNGFTLAGNYVHNFSTGLRVYRSSGTVDRNLVVDPDGGPDLIVFGGTVTSPSTMTISNNRLLDSTAGIIVSGLADQESPALYDLGANTGYAPAPPDSSPANVIDVTLQHNDCSNNVVGARLESRAAFPDPAVTSSRIHATLAGNHFDANQLYGVTVELGSPGPYHFDFAGAFSGNSFTGDGHAPLLFTFGSAWTAPAGGGGPYATASSITATGVGIAPGIGGVEYDDPAGLGNTIRLDSAPVGPGTVVTIGR